MISFLKSFELINIRIKLICIYVLNVTDIILTLSLKSTGAFMEGNPVMAAFMSNTLHALAIKIVLPAALVMFLYLRLRDAAAMQLKKANFFISALLILYALINVSHIVWSFVYISM